jgi:hypothetical protein
MTPETSETHDTEDSSNSAEMNELRSELQDKYRFYIMNPPYKKGVEYSLWMQEDDYEWPILSSNTGGFVTFSSRHKTVGEEIQPTEEFLNLLGLAFHEAMCFMPDIYFENDHFERRYLSIYDDRPREHEVWAAHVLLNWMLTGRQEIPEFELLARWAGKHTKFGVPVLGDDETEFDEER